MDNISSTDYDYLDLLDQINDIERLFDYNEINNNPDLYYPCNACGEDMIIDEIEDFNSSFCYCGKSPYCIP